MPITDHVVRLAKGVNLATVVTLMPDGRPQAQFTWIDTDGEYLLVNTVAKRGQHGVPCRVRGRGSRRHA